MSTQGSSRIGESGRGPDKGEAYGAAGITQHLHGVHFPISKDELIKQYGDQKFEWTKGGKTLTLRDCLESLPNNIQSITQITEAISHKMGQQSASR